MKQPTSQEPKQISEEEMRDQLRKVFAGNPEESLLAEFSRRLRDPAQPDTKTADGKPRTRLHPLAVLFGGVFLFVISIFIYFSFMR